MKILIVEDEIVSRRVIQNMIAGYGEFKIAIDGDEAVEAFNVALDENAPFDVILLDIVMPNLDGQEVLKKIRTLESDYGLNAQDEAVKIIMTTALKDKENIIKAFKNQCEAYLIKPIDKDVLSDLLDNLAIKN